jgi:hypothetical protein
MDSMGARGASQAEGAAGGGEPVLATQLVVLQRRQPINVRIGNGANPIDAMVNEGLIDMVSES